MIENDIKISQKKRNKGQLSNNKKYYKMWKNQNAS